MNETTIATTAKANVTGSNSPVIREVPTVAMESLISPLNATERPATPAKSTHHKKKETTKDCNPGKLLGAPPSLPSPRQQRSWQK